jgi:putative Mg2+ transporter-C (MgtC) family protein
MNYNFVDWQQIIYIAQILLAMILGGILGVQRERWGKWAGPRTYALVCSGSALFTVLSLYFFSSSNAIVAGAIVTGIGFLGAGTILRKDDRVEGLTTAAGLWMSAAIGMAVGANQYILSVAVTLMVLIILMIDDKSLKS